ncbi:DUF6786 family protein [Gaoshiqia sp. Z1-71]|uniref:DUF6786 family protein n=1 Tax=Gaoshiqia hydrogeniformans TaxID=3290090 RepID=UPI003BF869D5
MKAADLLAAFAQAGKATHLIGNLNAGVIIALDMEGRLFTVKDGIVLNRVNPEAISGQNTHNHYFNPGGDGLWPAPEGTTHGYQYSTGNWRVSPGLRGIRYMVVEISKSGATIQGEVDLINNKGYGIPTLFKRQISLGIKKSALTVQVRESITYIGQAELKNKDFLIAPWSLCQFDSGPGCEVVFPCTSKSSVWDLYDEPSSHYRHWTKTLCRSATDATMRYQIGLDDKVPYIEYRDPQRGLAVRRSAGLISRDHAHIDIRDASPKVAPSKKGVRYSVYSDPAGFMEIEAVGGCPAIIVPGTELTVDITTRFQVNEQTAEHVKTEQLWYNS